MDTITIALVINDWLGPLMMLGPLKLAFLAWVAMEIGARKGEERASEPAPHMPENS